jgi:DNA-nicking Smr family endonuclease
MDFGNILEKWENRNPGISHNKDNPLESWLHANDVRDKDSEPGTGKRVASESRRRLRAKKAEASIDIHGLTQGEAWTALEQFFAKARKQHMKKILVIHGKGNHSKGGAVLGQTVRSFIEGCPFAGESGYEKGNGGGRGATWVLLKGD